MHAAPAQTPNCQVVQVTGTQIVTAVAVQQSSWRQPVFVNWPASDLTVAYTPQVSCIASYMT
jgi:hypothetical protein